MPKAFQEMTGGIQWDSYSLGPVYCPSGRFYAYAPSVIVEGSTEHLWFCRNPNDGVIRDHIFYTRRVRGKVQQNETRSVLSAGLVGSWDSFHTCDPSVIKARVVYQGTQYSWVMFYLGNNVDASRHNQIGVAVARQPEGPWIKYAEPLVTASATDIWGVGQPSAILLDGADKILLFYTQGDRSGTRAFWREVCLVELSKPYVSDATALPTTGLIGINGEPDWLNSFDMVYAPDRDQFLAIREQHPYPKTRPVYIGARLQVVSIAAASVRSGRGTWRIEGNITPDLTGFPRNHNGGFKRTARGMLPSKNDISVVFSHSCAASEEYTCVTPEWSYDLWEISGKRSNAYIENNT